MALCRPPSACPHAVDALGLACAFGRHMIFFSASAADPAIFTAAFRVGMLITETLEAPEGLNSIFVRVCREKKEDPLILLLPELGRRVRCTASSRDQNLLVSKRPTLI